MSTAIEQLHFLKEQIEQRIKSINRNRVYYRRVSFWTFISTAILAAIITILLGLHTSEPLKEYIRIIALVITTVISLINTYNAFYNHKDMWLANNTALNKLYELKFNLEYFEKETPFDSTKAEAFKTAYQTIFDELNETWIKKRTLSKLEKA